MSVKKCVIFGAGDFNAEYVKEILKMNKSDICIAADAGILNCRALGIRPDIVIGDMDSLRDNSIIAQYDVKRLPTRKDDTDMLAAVKEGLALGYKYFEMYGALGGRLDHTMANIQCLTFLENRGARGTLYGDRVRVEIISGERVSYPERYCRRYNKISVFAYGGDAYGVTEKGLKYKLEDAVLKQEYPMGVSNEFTGRRCSIEVRKGRLLICVGNFS